MDEGRLLRSLLERALENTTRLDTQLQLHDARHADALKAALARIEHLERARDRQDDHRLGVWIGLALVVGLIVGPVIKRGQIDG